MRVAARFLLLPIFLLIAILFFVKSPVFAQTTTYSMDTNPDVPATLHTYTQTVMLEVLSSTFCLLAGQDPTNPSQPCLGFDTTTHKIGYVKTTGLLGTVTDMTAALYTPPVHVGEYFSYMANNFGFTKRVYANTTQCDPGKSGTGFCGISPLIGIWSTFRNIVYLFFVAIFIFIGFGIMFRMKIDPRTVMSIENQIPKLIIALLMVTFSFAIAGLLIDGMWLGSFVVVNVLTEADMNNIPDKTQAISAQKVNDSFFQNPIGFANNVLPGGIVGVTFGTSGGMGDVIRGLFTPENSQQLGLDPSTSNDCNNNEPFWGGIGNFFCTVGQGLGDILPGILGYLMSFVISILATLIILIALIYSMFRVWFALLLSYVYILLDVILAPFMIAFGVIPGSKMGFGSWLRDILANLMAFPTAIGMFLLARLFMDAFTTNGGTTSLFVTPLIGNPNGQAGGSNPLGFLIALGLLLMTPQVVNMSKALFKVQDNKFGQQIFQGIGKGTGAAGKATSGVFNSRFGSPVHWNQSANHGQGAYESDTGWRKWAKGFGWLRS